MKEMSLTNLEGISRDVLEKFVSDVLAQYPDMKKVLVVPPDYTRCYSFAGEITQIIYKALDSAGVTVHVIPALGTHMPMDDREIEKFFGGVVPKENILIHRWQTDTVKIGAIPAEVVGEISGGLYVDEIEVEVNHLLVDGGYDRIISVGQVVPHEVVGMANYSKNLFVGLGGRSMINKSHFVSAVCGLEKCLGVMDSPARKLYDYAQQHCLDGKFPVSFILTVTKQIDEDVILQGLFAGESRKPFEEACALSQEQNIIYLEHRAKKVVAYLDPDELKTTWVGNKGVYRCRMAVADGGDLILLAPGIKAFGENEEMDMMTRKYGYKGTNYVLDLYNKGAFEGRTMSAAHLIQGSSDGRFTITYCTRPEYISKEEINQVGYEWADYEETAKRYDPKKLKDGWNTLPDGEEIYYVSTPALGLWKCRE